MREIHNGKKTRKATRKDMFDWMKKAVSILGQEFNKQFPGEGKGAWKYFVFNTIHWED